MLLRIVPLEIVPGDLKKDFVQSGEGVLMRQQFPDALDRVAQRRRTAEAEIDAEFRCCSPAWAVMTGKDGDRANRFTSRLLRMQGRQNFVDLTPRLTLRAGNDLECVRSPNMRRDPGNRAQ